MFFFPSHVSEYLAQLAQSSVGSLSPLMLESQRGLSQMPRGLYEAAFHFQNTWQMLMLCLGHWFKHGTRQEWKDLEGRILLVCYRLQLFRNSLGISEVE